MSNKKPYFPFFMDISNAKGIIIGGGKQAYEKILRMQPFGPELTLIASEWIPEIEMIEGVNFLKSDYMVLDILQTADFVIVADSEEEVKRRISKYCKERRIPVNVVDEEAYSSYTYSAMVTKGALSIGISTAGTSPSIAVLLKEEINAWIPSAMDEILDWLEEIRPFIKEKILDKEMRKKVLCQIAKTAMEKGDILTKEEMDHIIS